MLNEAIGNLPEIGIWLSNKDWKDYGGLICTSRFIFLFYPASQSNVVGSLGFPGTELTTTKSGTFCQKTECICLEMAFLLEKG